MMVVALRDLALIAMGFSLALNLVNLKQFLAQQEHVMAAAAAGRRTGGGLVLSSHFDLFPVRHNYHHHNTQPQQQQIIRLAAQNKDNTRLEFVHVARCAGTAVVNAAFEQGIRWGYFHFVDENQQRTPDARDFMVSHNKLPPWHVPACMLDHQDIVKNPFSVAEHGPLDLFVIVRDPYERALSQYRYVHRMTKKRTGQHLDLNRFLSKKLRQLLLVQQQQGNKISKNSDSCELDSYPEDFFLDHGHWIPQYDFVYRTTSADELQGTNNNNNSKTVNMVRHVLKYENLDQEFAELMKLYGLERIQLPSLQREEENRATRHQLSFETIQAINTVYQRDFEAFGYRMMDPSEGQTREFLSSRKEQ